METKSNPNDARESKMFRSIFQSILGASGAASWPILGLWGRPRALQNRESVWSPRLPGVESVAPRNKKSLPEPPRNLKKMHPTDKLCCNMFFCKSFSNLRPVLFQFGTMSWPNCDLNFIQVASSPHVKNEHGTVARSQF